MKNICISTILVLFVLASCSTLKPESFGNSTPILDPVKFFGGHSHSSGVLETRKGKPSERITTKTAGVFANGVLTIDQDLHPEKEKPNHRTFTLKLTDAHHVEGTGSFIGGTARGILYSR